MIFYGMTHQRYLKEKREVDRVENKEKLEDKFCILAVIDPLNSWFIVISTQMQIMNFYTRLIFVLQAQKWQHDSSWGVNIS